MSKKNSKISLENLFNNNFDCYTEFDSMFSCIDEQPAITKEKFKEVCILFAKELLEITYKKAENIPVELSELSMFEKYIKDSNDLRWVINKDSIINTINEVES